jgi:transcriptional regulator with XRE-family HTH domain
MQWQGEKLKSLAKEQNIALQEIAEKLGVTRQTVTAWISGQIPKGHHLVSICSILGVDPSAFFLEEGGDVAVGTVHRTRMTAKVNPRMQESSINLAKEYSFLFWNDTASQLIPVVKIGSRSADDAVQIADTLRVLAKVPDSRPINYSETFGLLSALQINVVFRMFPNEIKSYAFHTRLYGHRLVIVNTDTNILDLIFPMLHESVHALREDTDRDHLEYSPEEESFCDNVASNIQFTPYYIDQAYRLLSGLKPGAQVNTLKKLAGSNNHSLHGVVKRIQMIDSRFQLAVGGADNNLKEQFPTIGEILWGDGDVRRFVEKYKTLSPHFFNRLAGHIGELTIGKLAELLDLPSVLDAKEVRDELTRIAEIKS